MNPLGLNSLRTCPIRGQTAWKMRHGNWHNNLEEKMKRKVHSFRVTLKLDSPVERSEVEQYTVDALICWAGSLMPPNVYVEWEEGDPMFSNVKEVIIS